MIFGLPPVIFSVTRRSHISANRYLAKRVNRARKIKLCYEKPVMSLDTLNAISFHPQVLKPTCYRSVICEV
eukprot:COSAG03_NODE_1375_length_4216_cov_3.811513_2_plen_71_part_00